MSRVALIVLSSLLFAVAQARPSLTNDGTTQRNGATVSRVDTQHQSAAEMQRHRHRHHHRRRR